MKYSISSWGHDWRHDYTKLGFFKKQFPDVPVMALTATATRKVEDDIKESLNTQHCECFRNSVDRPNLQYEARPHVLAVFTGCFVQFECSLSPSLVRGETLCVCERESVCVFERRLSRTAFFL